MGQAGRRAKYVKRASMKKLPASSGRHPWDDPKLSRADKVIAFVESLPCSAGPLAGTKFELLPSQKKFIKAVYATDRNNKRIVRTAVLSVARGNGKTTLAATLALCHLAGPEAESRGEVYSAANDRFQASRIHSEMAAIIDRVPWLSKRVTIRRFTKELEDIGGTGSLYAALSADAPTKHGLSPSFVVYDELGQAGSRDLLQAFQTAMTKRAEPLLMVISTQAARDEAPLSTLIDYGLRIHRDEVTDPSFHLTLYTAPEDSDPWIPKTWKLANPALGVFCSLEDVKRQALQAQRMPSSEASFRNFILNQRISATEQFITDAVWRLGRAPVAAESLKGRPCWAGLDLGATRDLTALVLVFADGDGGFDIVPHIWLPGDPYERRTRTACPMRLG